MHIVTGILLIALPIAFNVAFAALAARFAYPDILRRPTAEILERFRAGGSSLVLLWWSFAMTAVLLAPLAALVSASLSGADAALLSTALVVGVLAALVQFLGLIRWPFLVPFLARADADPETTPAQRDAIDIVFQSFNRYLGVAVGEHLAYLLSGAWTVLVGVAITQSTAVPGWIGVVGIVVGAVLALCSFEFVGRFEERGWRLAGFLTPIAYIAWSIWLAGTGIAFLL
ncbi:protein of unknown function [Microbacterium sp. cf046]|uniref:DUF4386 family protein n=1 Tax=Microbacterium sp. cf046 TaxID=1761803 RepID=UPI0008F1335D|nr:DUF4386 family protein [Microbacterium sp. cf046]SFS07785.1 protein of unknown function [Microbacterium sp. cf046]